MPSTPKPIMFRAVHTKTLWRKSSHETLANARSLGNRSALALFRRENDAIDYRKHGDALYVVIWDAGGPIGEVLKPDHDSPRGFQSKTVSLEDVQRWESAGGVSSEELERIFLASEPMQMESAPNRELAIPIQLPESLEQLEEMLQAAVQDSRSLSHAARRNRLASSCPQPRQIQVQTSAYMRNADVIVEVLERANGKCEVCREQAPFLRASDRSPYLEVHHIIPLALGGHDTVTNAQALCPNCHRRFHYGTQAT
ncbi:HNH endonuclease [Pseudomonas knackmussii]|uniref:HNH endonuclease n=1 Tax=Pseudomonas knackmussii TaxID=65741 RepID=UPI003F49C6A1